jgi:hypothetical protein
VAALLCLISFFGCVWDCSTLVGSQTPPLAFPFRSQNIRDPLRTKSYEKLWSTPPTVAVLLSAL